MDIVFESLDFSEKLILPSSGRDNGYLSMNASVELRGTGSFELAFSDEDVTGFMQKHKEGFFITWGKFQGFATDYQIIHNTESTNKIFGSNINAVVHKAVFPDVNITKDETIEDTLSSMFLKNAPWITFVKSNLPYSVEYSTEKYMNADEFLNGYLAPANLGYSVYISNKKLYIKLIDCRDNPLMLSINNLNVYNIQEDFSCKTAAFGGWYKKTEEDDGTKLEEEQWLYISKESKSGVFTQDVVLSSSSPAAAKNELEQYANDYTTMCKTRNIEFQSDYNLGDVVRLQIKNDTVKKQISSVDMWYEGSTYHEEPTLEELKG